MEAMLCKRIVFTGWLVITGYLLYGQDSIAYQVPPPAIQDVLTATPPPVAKADAQGKKLLLIQYQLLSSVNELACSTLGLAGLEIDSGNNGLRGDGFTGTMMVHHLEGDRRIAITGIPRGVKLSSPTWSPNGAKIAFCVHYSDKIELWYADASSGRAKAIRGIRVNKIFDNAFEWLSNEELLCRIVPKRGEAPAREQVIAPVVQENTGERKPARTYQDLLRDNQDAILFDYYARSQVVITNLKGKQTKVGQPGVIYYSSPSPDGNYVLIETIHRPYSYTVRYNCFPRQVNLYSRRGRFLQTVAQLPLLDKIMPSRDAASPVARRHDWRADSPATLYWIEAKDKGNPKSQVDIRDELYTWEAPFTGKPQLLHRCKDRFYSVVWGNDLVALVNERWWQDRRYTTYSVNPTDRSKNKELFGYSLNDHYANPGTPATQDNRYGREVLTLTGHNEIYLLGEGASPEGNRPFADLFDITTGQKKRLWQSQPPYYEAPETVLNADQQTILIKRESIQEPPNYFLQDILQDEQQQLTFYNHPYPQLKNVQKKEVRLVRADSVVLTAYIYLPKDYKLTKGRLPTVVWAYPVDYYDTDNAGQRAGSPYQFTYLPILPPVSLITQGYAVVLTTMPVVGKRDMAPNDSYLSEIKANAEAVLSKGYHLGIVDTARVAVAGHSYGASMVANLVTHTSLFKAGIALSGAYNRTLTPFGFQSEERTYWEATNTYNTLSPFHSAESMKVPLLLVHGESDNNSGTFPLQSDRYYQALQGLGATVRYVKLPYEDHTYRAKESYYHLYWEMVSWLDRYLLKSVPPQFQ